MSGPHFRSRHAEARSRKDNIELQKSFDEGKERGSNNNNWHPKKDTRTVLVTILLTALPSFLAGLTLNNGMALGICGRCISKSPVDSNSNGNNMNWIRGADADHRVKPQQPEMGRRLGQRERELLAKQNETIMALVEQRVAQEKAKFDKHYDDLQNVALGKKNKKTREIINYWGGDRRKLMIAGMAVTDVGNFTSYMDLGVPMEPFDDKNGKASKVVLLYPPNALPRSLQKKNDDDDDQATVPQLSLEESLEFCDQVDVWILDKSSGRCYALVPQLGSYQVQSWHRMKTRDLTTDEQTMDPKEPHRLASRSMTYDGYENLAPPSASDQKQALDALQRHLNELAQVKKELKQLVDREMKPSKSNSLVVMVCNHGQSELLLNFFCNAQSRSLDLSSVLVFATDQLTWELAKSLGLTSYYNEKLFAFIPTKAAKRYGDDAYASIMTSKSVAAQLISSMGYDFLFQDVDLIWYRHPLDDFFEQPWSEKYDIIFQDDGQHTKRFAPYAANSGFYFVRNNVLTQNFLNGVLLASDILFATGSHQKALVAILETHVSMYGLRAKVIPRESNALLSGWHLNRDEGRSFIKNHLITNNIANESIVFHYSWTKNKKDKIKYMQQMNEWFVRSRCIGKTLAEISGDSNTSALSCCLAEPMFRCHYRDKPSKYPCTDSPGKDGDESFWE